MWFVEEGPISRFILPLPSEDQVKLSKFNSDFSNKICVSCLKLSKTYSPSVFFKEGLMLYVFESLNEKQKFYLKTRLKILEIWTSMG